MQKDILKLLNYYPIYFQHFTNKKKKSLKILWFFPSEQNINNVAN